MNTPERLGSSEFWDRWVAENLPYDAEEPYINEVWTLSGQHGVGRTTVTEYLAQWTDREGYKVTRYSPGKDIADDYLARTGEQFQGPNVRPPQVNRFFDAKVAEEMLHPRNRGTLVLIEGRLPGAISRELQYAVEAAKKVFPANVHNVLLWADSKFRDGILLNEGLPAAVAYEKTEAQNFEYEADANVYLPSFKDQRGQEVYEFKFKSPMFTPYEMAQNIYRKIASQSLPLLSK